MRFSKIAGAVAALSVANASPIDVEVSAAEANKFMARQASTLKAAMQAAGKEYMGVALTLRGDSTEENIIKSEFDSITPENAMKWQYVEPSRNSFSFSGGDSIANFATSNGMELRCHTLVWHSQLPSWVSGGSWTSSQLQEVMRTHINNVAGRWKGKCTHWDVVNEALNEDGSYRSSVFYNVLGEDYIPMAFEMAAAADPNSKLYYNDYNLAYGGSKAQGAVRIVNLIKNRGIRIDGVGLQGHMIITSTPSRSALANTLRMFTNLGVDVAYTEIDIRMDTPETQSKLEQAAAAWGRMAGACMDVDRCVGMTVWGVVDKYSWVPSTFSGQGSALLWNDSYNKKPAYTGFINPILEAAGNPPTTTTIPSSSTTTAPPATTTTSGSNCSQKWGQCGGNNWTGATCCVSGSTCSRVNEWYSQCL